MFSVIFFSLSGRNSIPIAACNHIKMEMAERVLGFVAEWFDPHPQIVKKYLLKYYCET